MIKIKECQFCGKNFTIDISPSREKSGRGKFCDVYCKKTWSVGKHFSPKSEFQKGMKVFFSKKHRENISKARKGHRDTVGKVNGMWKGDEVGYYALHSWIKRKFGKAKVCAMCNSMKKVQWANKTHLYKRERSDWLELCYHCHRKYDMKNGWGDATRKFPELCKKGQ